MLLSRDIQESILTGELTASERSPAPSLGGGGVGEEGDTQLLIATNWQPHGTHP